MNISQLNYSMYKAAEHLAEAGKFLAVIDKRMASKYLLEANVILSAIVPEEERITEEKLDNLLKEILSVRLEDEIK